jgi:hypothetical protein
MEPVLVDSESVAGDSDGNQRTVFQFPSFLKEGERHVRKFGCPSIAGDLRRFGWAVRRDALPGAGGL